MLKILLAGLLVVLPVFGALALDFDMGGTLYNSTGYEKTSQTEDSGIDEVAALSLWFDLAGEGSGGKTWSLGAQVRGEYDDDLDNPWLVDLDYLRFNTRLPGAIGTDSILDMSFGRFYFSDPSGMVMTHSADGASVKLLWPKLRVNLSSGYTGLIINPKSDIRMTTDDWSDKNINDMDYYFGPKRVFALADFQFPDVGKISQLSLFAAAQFDLRGESDKSVLHTQYLGVNSNRRYGKHLYETFMLVLEVGELSGPDEDDRFMAGFLVGWDWRYLREDWLKSSISLRLLAAPPDFATDLIPGIGVGVMGYVPMNQPDLGVTVSPQLAGLGMIELGYSFMPLADGGSGSASRLQPYVNGRGYFRTWTVSVGWIETDPDSDSVYLGTELEGGVKWRMFSDVGLGLTGAVFLPAEAPLGAAAPGTDPLWFVRIDLSISF
jgi:hypothetical protein